MKIYTPATPKNQSKQLSTLSTEGPRQSTLDAIMTFASRYDYLTKS
ncbi:MAG: hypothetical protein IKC81_05505 [Paludibacteraceae bacterium]|nr:hypothetical protein [Paludibacteraceae bacterium]